MKKNLSYSIVFLFFTSFIQSCEQKKIPTATHAIYFERVTYPLSFAPTQTRTLKFAITNLVAIKALVYSQSSMTTVQRNDFIDSEISTKQLIGIEYSDGSIKKIKVSHEDSGKFVKIWPSTKKSSIIFGRISK